MAVGSFHPEHPAWVRYTIAASTASHRSDDARRPGGGVVVWDQGAAMFHRSSGAQVWTMSSITKPNRAAFPRPSK